MSSFLLVNAIFSIVMLVVFSYKYSFISFLIIVEFIFISAILLSVENSLIFGDIMGEIFVLVILTVAATESAIFLMLVVLYTSQIGGTVRKRIENV
jgi:NADH-quinone oxidoreductase subunit K